MNDHDEDIRQENPLRSAQPGIQGWGVNCVKLRAATIVTCWPII